MYIEWGASGAVFLFFLFIYCTMCQMTSTDGWSLRNINAMSDCFVFVAWRATNFQIMPNNCLCENVQYNGCLSVSSIHRSYNNAESEQFSLRPFILA